MDAEKKQAERQAIVDLLATSSHMTNFEIVDKIYKIQSSLHGIRKEEAPSEDRVLVQQIEEIMREGAIKVNSFNSMAKEIAKLLTPSQSYQAGLIEGKRQAGELLETLKLAKKIFDEHELADFTELDIISKAIQNAEPK